MILPTNVQLKFHRKEAPCTGIGFVAFATGFENSVDSGLTEATRDPSLNSCCADSFDNPACPGSPVWGEETEFGAELIDAPTTAASRFQPSASWRANRVAFAIALASVLPALPLESRTCSWRNAFVP